MRIGFLLPGTFALDGPSNGVRWQAQYQADALAAMGHEVARLDPWRPLAGPRLDVVQMFSGGFVMWGATAARPRVGAMGLATMIDSNEPNWRYRLAAAAGGVTRRVSTIPAELRRQATACDRVIVRSAHERDRVVRGLGIDAAKVRIVLNGVTPPAGGDAGRAGAEDVRRRLNLPAAFALHVSTYTQGRKNVERLVEAVGPTKLPLVIAGTAEPGPALDRLRALAGRFPNVMLMGYLDRPTLDGLMAACRVFCLPSLHEGTGLAALEAAAFGAEVVITRHGGPPDYFADLAQYVEPTDVGEIRRKVLAAWERPFQPRLGERVRSELTWEASARSWLRAYEGITG